MPRPPRFRPSWRTIRSLLPAGVVLVVVVTLGIFFQIRSTSVLEQYVRRELRTAADLGAMQFTAEELDQLHLPRDMERPEFSEVLRKLNRIRESVPNARFAYLFRKTENPQVLSFIADADIGKSLEELDHNGNGQVDTDEEPGQPGESYDILETPALQKEAFERPTTSGIYTDQWGTLLSGFAPVFNENGQAVAVLGIDMDAQEYLALSQGILSPLLLLLVFVVGVLMTSYVGVFIWKRRLENMRELDRERSRLMDLTLHQIGTPLSGMRWWLEILHDEAAKRPELKDHEAFQQLKIGTDRMTEVIEALAKASKLRRQELTLHPEPLVLHDLVETTLTAFQTELAYREQTVEADIDVSLIVSFDRALLTEVIQALVKNAMYYSPARSHIQIKANIHGKDVEVRVMDQGYGISSEELPGIFREMRRGSEAFKQQPVGNGLGLYTTKGIVERGGGDMWIDSVKGKGTTVHFTLPLATSH